MRTLCDARVIWFRSRGKQLSSPRLQHTSRWIFPQRVGGRDNDQAMNKKENHFMSAVESIHRSSHETTFSPTTQCDPAVLHRHLHLFDLLAIGVGGTIGSGIMVLCGVIARDYAGPATCISWAIAGVAALFSGACYAELAGRIPNATSAYSYAFATMGELPAFITAGCLTLEYMISGAAVARSWGDKVVEWLPDSWAQRFLSPGYGMSPAALMISMICTCLLLHGLHTSKLVTDIFTWSKVTLVLFMTVAGLFLMDTSNLKPFIPPEYGVTGVIRGATSSFFGYLGYDGVCCVANEAIDPHTNVPRAVLITLFIVTTLYIVAALSLTGMVPYNEISPKSAFPEAFHDRGWTGIAQFTAVGEIITLPIVVLISLMLQTRLQFALGRDGLLPNFFHELHQGLPFKGTVAAGLSMTLISFFIPFTYLNDFISAGILLAFSVTNSSLVFIRRESPQDRPPLYMEKMLLIFHMLSFLANVALNHFYQDSFGPILSLLLVLATIIQGLLLWKDCPPCNPDPVGSSDLTISHELNKISNSSQVYFTVPFVPFIPMVGIFINYFLISQLEYFGIVLLLIYISLLTMFYFLFGYRNSVTNNQGQRELEFIQRGYAPVLT